MRGGPSTIKAIHVAAALGPDEIRPSSSNQTEGAHILKYNPDLNWKPLLEFSDVQLFLVKLFLYFLLHIFLLELRKEPPIIDF